MNKTHKTQNGGYEIRKLFVALLESMFRMCFFNFKVMREVELHILCIDSCLKQYLYHFSMNQCITFFCQLWSITASENKVFYYFTLKKKNHSIPVQSNSYYFIFGLCCTYKKSFCQSLVCCIANQRSIHGKCISWATSRHCLAYEPVISFVLSGSFFFLSPLRDLENKRLIIWEAATENQ